MIIVMSLTHFNESQNKYLNEKNLILQLFESKNAKTKILIYQKLSINFYLIKTLGLGVTSDRM